MIRKLADWRNPRSLGNRFRSRRMEVFGQLLKSTHIPVVRILDVGGTPDFWVNRNWHTRNDIRITIANLFPFPESNWYDSIVANATSIPFDDHSFDVVFSNSTIEHLFSFESQQKMASEVRRLAPRYWVQTPNFWFPVEPHFHVPGWQFLPRWLRISMIRRMRCGWRGPCPDYPSATAAVDEVKLLNRKAMSELFPDAVLYPERFLGMVKSWVAHRGF